jgi:hypothetical protein
MRSNVSFGILDLDVQAMGSRQQAVFTHCEHLVRFWGAVAGDGKRGQQLIGPHPEQAHQVKPVMHSRHDLY